VISINAASRGEISWSRKFIVADYHVGYYVVHTSSAQVPLGTIELHNVRSFLRSEGVAGWSKSVR